MMDSLSSGTAFEVTEKQFLEDMEVLRKASLQGNSEDPAEVKEIEGHYCSILNKARIRQTKSSINIFAEKNIFKVSRRYSIILFF
jgi:hypothetical protein